MDLYHRFMKAYDETLEQADPRADAYYLMRSGKFNTISTLTYLFIVLFAGKRFMRNREPLNIRKFIFVYNLIMVVFSSYLFYEFLMSGWGTGYSLVCQECDYSNSPQALRMLDVCFYFWLSKHIEFLDTYFFIARKKYQHISFLHVFHHTLMAFTWWWGVKFSAGGLGTFHALINSFVHMVMYSYYAVAALGPKYQKFLWWKKHLTAFQMTQFVVVFGHMVHIIVFHDCVFPEVFKYIISLYGFLFFILFSNFWIQAYTKKRSKSQVYRTDANKIE